MDHAPVPGAMPERPETAPQGLARARERSHVPVGHACAPLEWPTRAWTEEKLRTLGDADGDEGRAFRGPTQRVAPCYDAFLNPGRRRNDTRRRWLVGTCVEWTHATSGPLPRPLRQCNSKDKWYQPQLSPMVSLANGGKARSNGPSLHKLGAASEGLD